MEDLKEMHISGTRSSRDQCWLSRSRAILKRTDVEQPSVSCRSPAPLLRGRRQHQPRERDFDDDYARAAPTRHLDEQCKPTPAHDPIARGVAGPCRAPWLVGREARGLRQHTPRRSQVAFITQKSLQMGVKYGPCSPCIPVASATEFTTAIADVQVTVEWQPFGADSDE